VRLQPADIEALDNWISKQREPISRPEALRAMMAVVLKVKPKQHQSPDQQKDRAREMAGKVIDREIDPAAPEGERVQRKRRLLKGPSEFIDARVDRPKAKK
jgi:hypothetical protein